MSIRWCLVYLLALLIITTAACGQVNPSTDVSHWENLEGPTGRFVTALAQNPTNPRELYAGALNGGVFKSTDGGFTWHPIDGQLKPRSDSTGRGEPDWALDVESIYVTRDDHIFAATRGQGMSVRSPEGTWIGLRRGLSGNAPTVTSVALGGEREELLYAGTQAGVYVLPRPAQKGDKWNRLDDWQGSLSERVRTLFASQETPPRLYAGTQSGFFRSLDGGETWLRATQGIDRQVNVIAMSVNPNDLDDLVISSWDTDRGEKHIYHSTDGGETWQLAESAFDSVVQVLLFSTTDTGPEAIYAFTYSGDLYISRDGGAEWELEDQLDGLVLSLLQTDEGTLVAGTDGDGIWLRDTNSQWTSARMNGVPLTVQSLLPSDNALYAGTECCGVFRQGTDGEWESFGQQELPLQARSINVLTIDSGTGAIYAGTNGDGVYMREPGSGDWQNWQKMKEGLPQIAWQIRSLVHFQRGAERILLIGTDDGLYKWRPYDQVWERVAAQALKEIIGNILWEPTTGTLFATATGGQLHLSHDGGKSWTPDEKAPPRIEYLALAHSTVPQRLILGSAQWTLFALTESNEVFYRTSDEGQWQQAEIDVDPNQQITLWSYPHHPSGFLRVRIASDDPHIFQQKPPPSLVTLVLQRADWQRDIYPIDAGILVVAADPTDEERLYAGTANDGVYAARVTLPPLWEQIPAGSPIKAMPLPVALLVLFALLAYGLYRWLMRPPKPVELEIEIEAIAQTNRYHIQVTGPEQRTNEALVDLPSPLLELKEHPDTFFATPTHQDVYAAGEHLFNFVFGDSALQNIYASSKEHARGAALRLRLYVEDGMANLPWEALYDHHVDQFLALTDEYPVTRRAKSAEPLIEWQPSRRLNVLAVTSSPREMPIPMIGQEVKALKTLSDRLHQVDIHLIEHVTPKVLLEALQTNTYQVLHFAGHADKDGLILEDGGGHSAPLDIADLAPVISGSTLTMVFLNACETASGDSQTGMPSLASILAAKGVPLVLAMQHEIPNDDALAFVQRFYATLADTGSVDGAVCQARQAIYAERESIVPPTWAIPVLLIRGSSSDLLRPIPHWQKRLGLHRRPIRTKP